METGKRRAYGGNGGAPRRGGNTAKMQSRGLTRDSRCTEGAGSSVYLAGESRRPRR